MKIRVAKQEDNTSILAIRMTDNVNNPLFDEAVELENINKAISQKSDISNVYIIEDHNHQLLATCFFKESFHRSGFTELDIELNDANDEETNGHIINKITELCFTQLNYHKINIELRYKQQTLMQALMRYGFKLEVVLKEHYYENNYYEDIYQFGMTKTSYILNIRTLEYTFIEDNKVEDRDYLLDIQVEPSKQLLVGEKIDLVNLNQADASDLYHLSLASNEKNFGTIAASVPDSQQSIEHMLEHNNDFTFLNHNIIFGIRNKEGKLVGVINAVFIDHRNRNCMLGVTIYDIADRGKGYGSEAICLITDFAFLELNMHRVYLGAFHFNNKAAGLYEHLGFKLEGVNRAFVYRNGQYYDDIAFGVMKKDWLRQRGYLKL